MWFLTVWLVFVLLEGWAFALLSGPNELLAAFLFKVAIAVLLWAWAPINGRVQLCALRLNPNAYFAATQLLVGLQSLIMCVRTSQSVARTMTAGLAADSPRTAVC